MNFLTERCFQKRRCQHKSGESFKNSIGALCSFFFLKWELYAPLLVQKTILELRINPLLCSLYPPWTVGAEFSHANHHQNLDSILRQSITANSAKFSKIRLLVWALTKQNRSISACYELHVDDTGSVSVACGYIFDFSFGWILILHDVSRGNNNGVALMPSVALSLKI